MTRYPGLAAPPARWRSPSPALLDVCMIANLWTAWWPIIYVQLREVAPATILATAFALVAFGFYRALRHS